MIYPGSIYTVVIAPNHLYASQYEVSDVLYASDSPYILSVRVVDEDSRKVFSFPGGKSPSNPASSFFSIPAYLKPIPFNFDGCAFYGFISDNARPVKVYKSLSLCKAVFDWSDGCPYDYLPSDSYNGYDASKDYSFSIQGDYLSGCDISNDYSNIVENVVNNNDYSDHSVSNVVNNFYYGEVGTEGNIQPTVDFRVDPDVGGGDDSGDSGEGGGSLIPGGGNTGGFIAQIEEMGSFFPKLLEKLNVFKQFPSEVGGLMDVGLSWIPPEDRALIRAGIGAFILIGLWHLLWKG